MATQHGGRQSDHRHHGGNQPGEDDPHGSPETPLSDGGRRNAPKRKDTNRGQQPVPERKPNEAEGQ